MPRPYTRRRNGIQQGARIAHRIGRLTAPDVPRWDCLDTRPAIAPAPLLISSGCSRSLSQLACPRLDAGNPALSVGARPASPSCIMYTRTPPLTRRRYYNAYGGERGLS
jgi:hypothetical protein